MNLFGFNLKLSRPEAEAAPAVVQKTMPATPAEWLRGEDVATGPQLANAYQQVVWVYRAVNALAEQVANVPFLLSRGERGRENLITSGPLLDFYAQPHPQIDRFQYWELRVMWLLLRGECVRIPVYADAASSSSSFSYSSSSRPQPSTLNPQRRILKRVLILDPALFQHIIEDQQLIGWRYTGLGLRAPLASQVFLPEEVWFEKLPNPFDFWRGFPPLAAAALAAETDFAAGAFMRGVIENNADTGLVVRTDKWLSDEQREQIVTALRERKRRAGVADRPVLLPGSAEVIRPQLSSSDLQFLENRKFSRAEICAAFGVPEEIVSSTEHAKYDVMAGARLNFIENRVAPLCNRLEAAENLTTIPAILRSLDHLSATASAAAAQPSGPTPTTGWFDLDSLPVMQEARRSRLAAARAGFEMGVPFNELNRVLDLGFRPLPWGDEGYISTRVKEATANGGARPTAPGAGAAQLLAYTQPPVRHSLSDGGSTTNSQPSDDPDDPLRQADAFLRGLGAHQAPPPEARSRPFIVEASACAADRQKAELPTAAGSGPQTAQPASPRQHQLERKLHRFLFEQRRRVLDKLSILDGGARLLPSPGADQADSLLEQIFDLGVEDSRLAALLQPLSSSAGTAPAPGAPSGAQPDGPFFAPATSNPQPPVRHSLGGGGSTLNHLSQPAIGINQHLQRALAPALSESLAARESFEQLRGRVRALYNQTAARLREFAETAAHDFQSSHPQQ